MSQPLSIYKRMPKQLPYSLGFDRYALYFDGENDYVEVPDAPELNPTDGIVLEAMYRWDGNYKVWPFVINKRAQYQLYFDLETPCAGAKFQLFFDDGSYIDLVTTRKVVCVNRWVHQLCGFDGRYMYIIVNGELLLTRDTGGKKLTTTTNPLGIGARLYDAFFGGWIAFVRIYDARIFNWLSAQGRDIVWLARYNMLNYHNPVRDGLVLWLDFEEGHGDKVYDKSGYGNHGTIYGGAKWVRVKQYELRAEVGL